ncbi:UNVERIFIED_CONTAM: Endoribonuclease YBEY, chloroplastic [Sesamum angustifolium]|uniref:Endoribonuclease YBEY, chloroplastic n=1 Tax=Sesamum angustifolium TaxID=2727405 RepID=A0AAW2LUT8_9LAMI
MLLSLACSEIDSSILKTKLIFLDTSEGVASTLCPYWADATEVRAFVVQVVWDMLEIVALGILKECGVRILLDHLGITLKEYPTQPDALDFDQYISYKSVKIVCRIARALLPETS